MLATCNRLELYVGGEQDAVHRSLVDGRCAVSKAAVVYRSSLSYASWSPIQNQMIVSRSTTPSAL